MLLCFFLFLQNFQPDPKKPFSSTPTSSQNPLVSFRNIALGILYHLAYRGLTYATCQSFKSPEILRHRDHFFVLNILVTIARQRENPGVRDSDIVRRTELLIKIRNLCRNSLLNFLLRLRKLTKPE